MAGHQTCVFTKMPIFEGEKCYIVLLASDFLDRKVLCESTSLYKPLFRPFSGIYDGYGFARLEQDDLKRLVDAAIFLGIEQEIIGTDEYEMASNIGHHISYGDVIAGNKARQVNYCMISGAMHSALNDRLIKMSQDIDHVLLPAFEQQKTEALASQDDFMIKIANRDDPIALMQISVAKVMHQCGHYDLAHLAQRGLTTDGARHTHTTLMCPLSLRDNLKEAGELQVLSEFLSSVRGFWSPQSGQGNDHVITSDYELLSKVIENEVKLMKGRYEEDA